MKAFVAICLFGVALAAPQFNQRQHFQPQQFQQQPQQQFEQPQFLEPQPQARPQSRPQQHSKQQRLKDEIIKSPPQPYNFGLQVSDDPSTNYQTRQESQDELGNVEGQYSWVGSDGFRYITNYSATPEGGFQAKTIKEPTDIVVIIPEPKPEFQDKQQRQQQHHQQQQQQHQTFQQQPGGRF